MCYRFALPVGLLALLSWGARAQDAPPPGPGAGEAPAPPGWREHRASDGSFAVWVPEKSRRQAELTRTVGSGALRLKINALLMEMSRGPAYTVEHVAVTSPPGGVNHPGFLDALHDLAVGRAPGGRVTRAADATMGPLAGNEYEVQSPAGYSRVRVFVAEGGAFVLRVAGTRAQVDGPGATRFLDSCRPREGAAGRPVGANPPGPSPRVASRGPRTQGGGNDPEFRDAAPRGGLLVGVEVGLGKFFNNDVVKAVRPVYRARGKVTPGKQFGTDVSRVVKAVARPGYAVGAITLKTGLGVDGLSVTFMKAADGQLDPADSYQSAWLGGEGGGGRVTVGGDGTPVVGLLVKANGRDVSGLGLIYQSEGQPGSAGASTAGVPSRIQGGGGDPEFRDAGPAGALFVGLEVGVGRFFNNPVLKSVRPIYRAGAKVSSGRWHGPTGGDQVKEVVKVVSKPGYAVGAITVKGGLGLDGLSVTYMKVVKGKLDPGVAYESEWVGGRGGGGPTTVGDGTPVIGLIGKARDDTVSGLGLLHASGSP